MSAIRNQEWLNQNAARAYPFEEDMQRIPYDPNGAPLTQAQLPNYVLVDMVFTMPGTGMARAYLAQLTYVGNLLTLVFRETLDSAIVSAVTVDAAVHAPNTAYPAIGTGEWADARGWVTIGDLTRLREDLPEGLYTYAAAQTLLEARVVRPALRGVRSLRIANNGNVSGLLYDHIKLLAGENIRLVADAVANGVWIHAAPNSDYVEDCPCAALAEDNVVNTINGIPIEDVVIVGDGECVDVTTTGNKIIISDKCSEPCCGCPELDFLTQTVKVLETSLSKLESYADRLNERITTFVTNFVMTLS